MTNGWSSSLRITAAMLTLLLLAGCSDSAVQELPSEEVAVYKLEASPRLCPNEPPVYYTVTGAENIAAFEGRPRGYLEGTVAAGDGDVNAPWSWHYVPNSMVTLDILTFVEATSCPGDLERNVRQGILTDPLIAWTTITRQR